jgi:hypothetical protein
MNDGLRKTLMWLIFAVSFTASSAENSTFAPINQETLVRDADLIFKGEVVRVESRLSDRKTSSDLAVPHTFVTFSIDRLFKGSSTDGDYITLRFQGGASRDGRFFHIDGMPIFQVGDQDVLFVKANGVRLCPIVGWSQGRLRVIEDELFSNTGREVWLNPDGRLVFGRVEPKAREAWTYISPKLSLKEKKTPTLSKSLIQTKKLAESGATRLNVDAFNRFMDDLVMTLHKKDELKRILPVKSLNIHDRFFAPILHAAPGTIANPIVDGTKTKSADEGINRDDEVRQ